MSLSSNLLQSSSMLLSIKMINRGIGLISTIILARILTPYDFGIVALTSLVIHFFEAISNPGTKEYLIQKKGLIDDDVSTGWTLNLIIKFIVWIAFIILTPYIAEFYDKPELTSALYVISLMVPIAALSNDGVILFMKELNYSPLFYLELTQKLVAFSFTISFAFILKSYWAMIIGIVVSFLFKTFGTYYVHDFRPKFSLKNIKVQWEFSKWILPRGIIGFSRSEIDTFLVSKSFGFVPLGGFNMMKSLTNMVGWDVLNPATEPLLASFSKVKDDMNRLNFQLLMSTFIILTISLPVVGFILLFHKEIILLLLGEQWTIYSEVLAALSLLILTFGLTSIFQHLLTSLGKVKVQFNFEIIGLIVTAGFLLLMDFKNLVEFSIARSMLAILLIVCLFVYVKILIKFSVFRYLKLISPLILALLLAWGAVVSINFSHDMITFFYLLFNGIVFVSVYALALFLSLYLLRHNEEVIYLKWLSNNSINALKKKLARK